MSNSCLEVYKLSSDCGEEIHWRKKKCAPTRSIEHQENSMTGKCKVLDTTEHFKDCYEQFNWLHPKSLAKLPNMHEHKIREFLEINNLETKAENDKYMLNDCKL